MTSQNQRIVVTGLGLVTPVGVNVQESWQNLCAGKSGISNLPDENFPADQFPSRIAGQVKDELPQGIIPPKIYKQIDRFIELGWHASHQALSQAELLEETEDGQKIPQDMQERTGLILGSGIGGINEVAKTVETLNTRGAKRISPFFIPAILPNLLSGQVSLAYGLKGPNSCSVTACATGSHSIIEAIHYLKEGAADVMLAGGAESALAPVCVGGFSAARALSTGFNDNPTQACRPFDGARDGFVIAEGAAMLVLETLEHAQKRGAKILAEITGWGATADAYHITQPSADGEGGRRAMQRALTVANLTAQDVSAVSAHATSTPVGDGIEARAIASLFPQNPPVMAVKSMVGHTLGAAGALATVSAVLSVQNGILPPVINCENPNIEAPLNIVKQQQNGQFKHIMVNAFGFGGTNAAVLVSQFS